VWTACPELLQSRASTGSRELLVLKGVFHCAEIVIEIVIEIGRRVSTVQKIVIEN